MKTWTRKDFLKTSLLTGSAAPPGSPNGDIRIAIVGFNGNTMLSRDYRHPFVVPEKV